MNAGIDAFVEEKPDHLGVAIPARVEEPRFQLFPPAVAGFQLPAIVETPVRTTLRRPMPAAASIEAGAAIREEPGRFRLSVREAADHDGVVVAGVLASRCLRRDPAASRATRSARRPAPDGCSSPSARASSSRRHTRPTRHSRRRRRRAAALVISTMFFGVFWRKSSTPFAET